MRRWWLFGRTPMTGGGVRRDALSGRRGSASKASGSTAKMRRVGGRDGVAAVQSASSGHTEMRSRRSAAQVDGVTLPMADKRLPVNASAHQSGSGHSSAPRICLSIDRIPEERADRWHRRGVGARVTALGRPLTNSTDGRHWWALHERSAESSSSGSPLKTRKRMPKEEDPGIGQRPAVRRFQ